MEITDVKGEARRQIDKVGDNILAMVQIIADDEGHVSVCVGGIPDVIVRVLGKTMRDNHQIKDLFEAAWIDSTDVKINPSLN